METKIAIEKRRSIRKFYPDSVTKEQLTELIRLGRLYCSATNAQPVYFAAILKKENCDTVFSSLRWAGRVPEFSIEKDREPAGYVLLLSEEKKSPFFEFDAGCAATTMMLAAEEMGLSSCLLKIAFPDVVKNAFDFKTMVPVYALALGKGAMKSRVTDQKNESTYYMENNGDFVVTKRTEAEVSVFLDWEK